MLKPKDRFEKDYLDENPFLNRLIKQLVEEASGNMDGWSDPRVEPVECRRRDGFIPNSYNHGGWEASTFLDLDHYRHYQCGSEVANQHIQKQIESTVYGIDDPEKQEEALQSEESSVMLNIRIMYHGSERGIHRASVSACINWEGPYHRSSISWMKGFKCETAEEIEVTWKTAKSARTKLQRALKKVMKIF